MALAARGQGRCCSIKVHIFRPIALLRKPGRKAVAGALDHNHNRWRGMNIAPNMSRLDQSFRFVAGSFLVYIGFVHGGVFADPVSSVLVGVFGLANVTAAVMRHCYFYRFAGIDTHCASATLPFRSQLLWSFIAVAALVLLVFGGVSYYLALDSGGLKQAALWHDFAAGRAAGLSAASDAPALAVQLRRVDYAPVDNELTAVVDSAGQALTGPPLTAFPDVGQPLFLPGASEAARHRFGYVRRKAHVLLWATAPVPGSGLTLVTLHRARPIATELLETLGMRLLVTAGLVIWIAIWGALILSRAMALRLEKHQQAMLHQAMHDPLTGLPNRAQLYRRLSLLAAGDSPAFTLIVMDLDRFKDINDTLGHDCGDRLLQGIGARLGNALAGDEMVARLGGDEFAVLIPGLDHSAAFTRAKEMQAVLRQPFPLSGIDIVVDASLGLAHYPDQGRDARVLIQRAEVAMYHAKQHHLGCVAYSAELDPYTVRRLTIMGDLQRAIEEDQLVPYYQPKVNLRYQRTEGVEVLLRWRHPVLGLLGPEDFIPLAEQSALIRPLTEWVLNAALCQCRAWREAGMGLGVAVNLSPKNLHDVCLPVKVAALLERWQVPPSALTLEITETALMADPRHALKILTQLHTMGVKLSIDDFGTGYSSLVYLKELPVSEIKIDRSFVLDMLHDDNDAVIVHSTLDLGHNLGCRVVAEGVENDATLERLRQLGCDSVQGYYFSHPLPVAQFEDWLKTTSWPGVPLAAGQAAAGSRSRYVRS
ncbi:MAG TPA: EAL domain-containing protein [Gammaproteobacteria bacterium]|nr:EAL domain-containing protein [Gammaproteobacteria bacterium]